ncbi:MAG: hypothetical protein EX270_11130 [Pseudomonadales bacterium]|nr:MAG: hypothetical protein EX270_11130 [Pseudomonadales bacterium]
MSPRNCNRCYLMSVETLETMPAQLLSLSQAILTAAEILKPPPNRNAGQWANDSRVLPPSSPEPGAWRTDRTPYWWQVYEAFSTPGIEEITIVCGAQMGKTEALFNVIGHRMDDGAYVPAMYVGATEQAVKSISKDRVDKMLESSKSLYAKLEKGQRNGVYEKFIGGVRLGFAWAGSATQLSSQPVGLCLIDEVDRMSGDTQGEGDPITLARARCKNFSNRKIGAVSTPTVEGGSAIWSLYESSAMFMWAWHCRHCNQAFVPQLSLLQWPEGKPIEETAEAAEVVCPHCGGTHANKHKRELNINGRYLRMRRLGDREQAPEGKQLVLEHYVESDDNLPARAVGFWVSGLCSPWASFYDVAAQLLRAYKSTNVNTIQAVINTYGGELFRLKGEAPDWGEVAACRQEYLPGSLPSREIQFIVLGADVQKHGIYYCVRGFGAESESYLLDNDYLNGETEHDNVWIALGQVLSRQYEGMPITRALIDSGYRPGDSHKRPDHAVYTFCRNMSRGIAFPAKGRDTMESPVLARNIDYTHGGKVVKNGVKLWHINTDYFKRWVHARIRWPEDADRGGWFLHNQASEDYCRQMVAEELVIKASGKAIWIRRNKENHYLDCEVLTAAAAYSLNVHTLRPVPPKQQQRVAQAQAEKAQQVQQVQRSSVYQRKSLF